MSILRTNQIQDTGTNVAANISGGTVSFTNAPLTSTRPFFRVGMGTSQTGITDHTVIFDTIKQNIGGHYSTSNGRFTAPVNGVYQFGHSVLFQDVATSDDGITLHYYKNGLNDLNKWQFGRADGTDANGYSGTGGYLNNVGSGAMQLSAGDYVIVNVFATGAIGVHGNSNQSWSQWYGYLIG